MQLEQIETGARNVFLGHFKGVMVRVVTGYVALQDDWAVHVYLTPPGRGEYKLPVPQVKGVRTMDAAFDRGVQAARNAIDGGLQHAA